MKTDTPLDGETGKPAWGFLIHEVARLLKRRFEEEARKYGLTLPQWRALAQISIAGDSSQSALAAALDADPMTVSGILDRLEKRGLIMRYPDPADSRAKLTEVTEEGARLVSRARNVGRGLFEEAMAGVSDSDRDTLIRALGCIRDNLLGETARSALPGHAASEKELN
jgi:DNA-binding MarR family transcriptional regulator